MYLITPRTLPGSVRRGEYTRSYDLTNFIKNRSRRRELKIDFFYSRRFAVDSIIRSVRNGWIEHTPENVAVREAAEVAGVGYW